MLTLKVAIVVGYQPDVAREHRCAGALCEAIAAPSLAPT